MFRTLFILALVAAGAFLGLQGPFYGLLFYIANAYFRPEDWVWIDLISNLHLSLVSGVYVTLGAVFSGQRLVPSWRLILVGIFLFHTLVSILLGKYFENSWGPWTDFLKTILIVFSMQVLITDYAKFRTVLLVMVLALGLEGAKQGWVYILTKPGSSNDNPIPFLGDNNGVAVGMLMLVPIVGFLIQTTRSRPACQFYWVLFIGVLYRALSTFSRGGFLSCLVMTGLWWLRSQKKLRAAFAIILCAIILIPALPESFWHRMQTIQTYEEGNDSSALGRLHFWKVAVDMANANPILGVGFYSYNSAYDAYDFSTGRYGSQRAVHSSFFGLLAEVGYVGVVLAMIIFWGALRSCARVRRLVRRKEAAQKFGYIATALEMSLIVFLVGGSFLAFQYNEMLWHIIGLTIVLERLATQQESTVLVGDILEEKAAANSKRIPTAA